MTHPSRRSLLCSTASIVALSAGCIADDPGSASNGDGGSGGDGGSDGDGSNDGDNGNETDGTDGSPENGAGDELADCETRPFQYPERSESPDVALLLDQTDGDHWLAEREPQPDAVTEFIDATDFEASVIVALEAGAPNPCYGLVIDELDIDDGDANTEDDDALSIDAAVRGTSDESRACTQQIVTVGRLVRATFESEPLTRVSASVVDQNGQEHGIGIASESASASDGSGSSSGN
ncbi:hypothetical protein [Natrinema caseinilyticum]|uniref:hypothetical protein n=1 Tax=Natrinema caseinilyticum TaxID=2961570 RepID=UPI0020C1D50F|nr:hypothetical protein [Natrinema caseinilyticum]